MLEIIVDLARCEGYANCVVSAPDLFDLSESGKVIVLREPDLTEDAEATEAVASCPARALEIRRS